MRHARWQMGECVPTQRATLSCSPEPGEDTAQTKSCKMQKMQMARATRTEKFKFVPECLQLKWKRYPEVPQLTLKAIQKASPRVPNQAQRTPKKDPRKGAPKLGRKRGCSSHVTRGWKALKRYKFQGFFNSGTQAGTLGSGVYRHPFWGPFLGFRGVPA